MYNLTYISDTWLLLLFLSEACIAARIHSRPRLTAAQWKRLTLDLSPSTCFTELQHNIKQYGYTTRYDLLPCWQFCSFVPRQVHYIQIWKTLRDKILKLSKEQLETDKPWTKHRVRKPATCETHERNIEPVEIPVGRPPMSFHQAVEQVDEICVVRLISEL